MKQPLEGFLLEWRHTYVVLGMSVIAVITSAFWMTGTLGGQAPWYFSSQGAFHGMILLIILVPAYFAVAAVYGIRRSAELARQVDTLNGTQLESTILRLPGRQIALFALFGFLYAVIFNIPGHGVDFLNVNTIDQSMILGQVLIWTVTGCLLATRFHVIRAFHHASRQVDINLFETSNLKPFARIGQIDVLIIAGVLVLSTVQSLDFSFRSDNYSKALIIAIPSALYLTIYPMWDIHKRMLAIKTQQLADLAVRISQTSTALSTPDVNELEVLLQRRERVLAVTTWPLDITILQRFLFYIIIPPLAWVGAAIVEYLIEGMIRG